MRSICNFLPPKKRRGEINIIRFVYETEIHLLKQPFYHTAYFLNVVTDGYAKLKIGEYKYPLRRGTVFFSFPGVEYEVTDFDNFTYTYISFSGDGATELLREQNITEANPVIDNLSEVCDFFGATVGRVNQNNANYLGEAALYYAFAQIADRKGSAAPIKNSANLYDAVTDYINRNYSNPSLSLSEISGVYFYSEKHLSSVIKKNCGVGFTEYLTRLRINRAIEIMKVKNDSIAKIAFSCGFSDPLYFSKVFKKRTGKTPSVYMQELVQSPLDSFIKKYAFLDED